MQFLQLSNGMDGDPIESTGSRVAYAVNIV